jgi:hypothetical protein
MTFTEYINTLSPSSVGKRTKLIDRKQCRSCKETKDLDQLLSGVALGQGTDYFLDLSEAITPLASLALTKPIQLFRRRGVANAVPCLAVDSSDLGSGCYRVNHADNLLLRIR